MCAYRWVSALGVVAGLMAGVPALAETGAKENTTQVDDRNAFADDLMRVHRHRLATRDIRKKESIGGYARMPDYYREVEYRDAADDRLLSRIRWIRERPDQAQMVEVFFHDDQGRVSADYYVSYLAEHRNAPIFALINVHAHSNGLHAFRQFEFTYGDILFERCQGSYQGKPVDLSLDEMELPPSPDVVSAELYDACFGALPKTPGRYLKPATLVPDLGQDGGAAQPVHDRMDATLPNLA